MIGTSILTVYQGHISRVSVESSTDGGRLLRSLSRVVKAASHQDFFSGT